jgi:hypothetical protein
MEQLAELKKKVDFLSDLETLEVDESGELIMGNYNDYPEYIEKVINYLNARLIAYKETLQEELKNEIKVLSEIV